MARIGIKPSIKAHKEHMELENIIEEMGNAMRGAYLPYIAEADRLTPKMEWQLQRFKWYAMKTTGRLPLEKNA